MKTKDYLICYDIRFLEVDDKKAQKRLRKIVKFLETISFRIQKSVFFMPDASKDELEEVIFKLKYLSDYELDDIRIYTIKNYGLYLGNHAIDLRNIDIIS